MEKEQITLNVHKVQDGYSAGGSVVDGYILTEGDTFADLQVNILDAVNGFFEEKGIEYELHEITLIFNLPSFFEIYSQKRAAQEVSKASVSELAGRFHLGDAEPTDRIAAAISTLGQEMAAFGMAS